MTLYSRIARALLVIALTFVSIGLAQARRMIPDDNLAYPVLIILKNKAGATLAFGSGVYLATANAEYLVTAKHVIADGLPDETHKAAVPDLVLQLVSYSKDQPTQQRILLTVDFQMLLAKRRRAGAQNQGCRGDQGWGSEGTAGSLPDELLLTGSDESSIRRQRPGDRRNGRRAQIRRRSRRQRCYFVWLSRIARSSQLAAIRSTAAAAEAGIYCWKRSGRNIL